MKAIIVKTTPVWGFSIKYPGQSAAQDAFPYPPPSTLLGALASGYARLNGLPEKAGSKESTTIRLLDTVRYVTVCMRGFGVKQLDPQRNIVIGFQRKERRKNPKYWRGLQAMGKMYALNSELRVVYIVEDGYAIELARAAWNITYIGGKESLVNVKDVEIHDMEVLEEDYCETCYMVPAGIVVEPPENSVKISFWDWRDKRNYQYGQTPRLVKEYYIPYIHGMLYGCVNDECMKMVLDTEKGVLVRIGDELLPLPREVVEGGVI